MLLVAELMVVKDVFPSLPSLGFVLGAAGSLGIVVGAYWDATWHRIQLPETFWIPPHVVLYSSAGILALVTSAWLLFARKWPFSSPLAKAYRIVFLGVLVQLFAGAFDQWWHTTFGVDKALSPPHLILVAGILISFVASFSGLTSSLNLATTKSWRNVLELSRVIIWISLWSVLVALATIFILPDPFTSVPTITQLTILEASFTFGALFMILLGIRLIQLRWSATLLVGSRTLLILYPTNILADPAMYSLAAWFYVIIIPAILFDVVKRKVFERSLYLLLAGAAIASFFNFVFYPVNYAIYRGVALPVTIESNGLMAAVGLFGALASLGAGRWLNLAHPRMEMKPLESVTN